LGIARESLLGLSIGTLLIGGYQAFAQFYRFAASEAASDTFRPHAISLVLGGGVVAALLGPALAMMGEHLLEPAHTGSFLILAVLALVAVVLLWGVRAPLPDTEASGDRPRPLTAILRQPTYAVALLGAVTGSGVMVVAMTATPLAMTQHGHAFAGVATVIQLHVLGMFGPSFFTGALISRFGTLRIMCGGAGLLAAHAVLSFTGGIGFVSFACALVLLGVGWNFLFVGSTTLLTSAYRPVEKGLAQAANDLLVLVVVFLSSIGAGALLHAVGWQWMNVILLPWLLMAVIAVL
jgi:MFS family permease